MDWFLIGGGESGWIVVDPDDHNILYATGAYGGVVRYDRRTSLSQDITPWPMPNVGNRNQWAEVSRAVDADAGDVSDRREDFVSGNAVRDEDD